MPPVGISPSARCLASVEKFKLVVAKDDLDASQHQAIQYFLNVASEAVMGYCGREFVADPALGNTRSFEYTGGGYVRFGPYDLQAVSQVQIDADTPAPITITSDQYQLLSPAKYHGVWTDMRLNLDYFPIRYAPGSFAYPWSGPLDPVGGLRRQISVQGTWGWPAIPAEAEFATILTAAMWLQKNQETFSATFNLDTSRVELPSSLPTGARKILDPIKKF